MPTAVKRTQARGNEQQQGQTPRRRGRTARTSRHSHGAPGDISTSSARTISGLVPASSCSSIIHLLHSSLPPRDWQAGLAAEPGDCILTMVWQPGTISPQCLPTICNVTARRPCSEAAAHAAAEPALLPAAGPAALRKLHRRQPALAPPAAAARLQCLRLLPLGRRSGRRDRRPQQQPGPAGLVGDAAPRLLSRPGRSIRCSSPWPKRSASSTSRSSRSSTCWWPFGRTSRSLRYETSNRCWNTAAIRPIRWAGWCCISASATRPSEVRLSDSICTGLQLANFCQDVARDWDRGRIYLPQAACRRFGYDEAMFARRECNDAFRQLLAAQVDQAEGWLRGGLPLAAKMPPGLRLPVALFVQGGLATLEAIRRQNYDVWTRRPTVSRFEKLRLVDRVVWWRLPVNVFPPTPSRRATLLPADEPPRGLELSCRFLLLPREKRRAMEALYAFMRHTDDLADDPHADHPRRTTSLAAWRAALERGDLRASSIRRPVGRRSGSSAMSARPGRRRAAIPHSPRTSLRGDRRRGDGPDAAALRNVRRVAGRTASAWRRPWGWRAFISGDFAGREAFEPATKCGIALQLTNILRDLKEDAAAGSRLSAAGRPAGVRLFGGRTAGGRGRQRFHRLMAMEVARAEQFYAGAAN